MCSFLMHHSAEIGLLMFLASFLVVLIFALTRSKTELDDWASLPLGAAGSSQPQEDAR